MVCHGLTPTPGSQGLELQAGEVRIRGEVPQLEEEGVVVGEEALLRQGAMCATGQFPGTRRVIIWSHVYA